ATRKRPARAGKIAGAQAGRASQEQGTSEQQRSTGTSDAPLRRRINAELQHANFRGCRARTDCGVAVTQEVNDCRQLLPAVDHLEARLKKKPQQMIADKGYTTRETIEAMAERKIDFLGSMLEEKKRGRPALERFPPTAVAYDCKRDCFVCPEGKLLGYEGSHTKKKGFTYYRYEAEWRDCQSCARKPQCCPENRKRGRACLSLEDGQRRSASTVPPPGVSRGILSRVDQKQTRPTTVPRARVGKGTNGNAVGLPYL